MAHKYLIGIDNGTSGAKCIAVDETGKVAASATVEYPLYTPCLLYTSRTEKVLSQPFCAF